MLQAYPVNIVRYLGRMADMFSSYCCSMSEVSQRDRSMQAFSSYSYALNPHDQHYPCELHMYRQSRGIPIRGGPPHEH